MSEIPNCEEDFEIISKENKEILKNITKSASKRIRDEYFTHFIEHIIPIEYQPRLKDEFKHFLYYIEDTGNTSSSTGVQSDENFFNVLQEPKFYRNIQAIPVETSSTTRELTEESFPSLNKVIHCKEVSHKTEKIKPIEEIILKKLSEYSSRLKKLRNYDRKVALLVELDKFLKENEDIIKRKFSGKLKSILRSI